MELEQGPLVSDALSDVRRKVANDAPLLMVKIVLEALTDTIDQRKNSGDDRLATDYFSLLSTTLQKANEMPLEALGATLYLLASVLPQLPMGVVESQFTQTARLLLAILKLPGVFEQDRAVKALLQCVAAMLANVQNTAQWAAHEETARLLRTCVVFSTDARPKIRKVAQLATGAAFAENGAGQYKPVTQAVQEKIVQEIEACTARECTEALYLCAVLHAILPFLPNKAAAAVLQPLLQLASKGNTILMKQSMHALHSLFAVDHDAMNDKQTRKHADLVFHVLTALGDMPPHSSDIEGSAAYFQAVASGVASLAKGDRARASQMLPSIFKMLADTMLSHKTQVARAACKAMCSVAFQTLDESMVRQALQANKGGAAAPLPQVLATVEGLLHYRYKEHWAGVFELLRVVLGSVPRSAGPLVVSLLNTMDGLRRSEELVHGNLLDQAFGAAVTTFGEQSVLELLPLDLPLDLEEGEQLANALENSRVWLLPLIKSHVKHGRLGFFAQHLLTRAQALYELQDHAVEAKLAVRAKSLQAVIEQIWECFPAFCALPVDVAEAFEPLAVTLKTLLDQPRYQAAHTTICRGLATLIRSNAELAGVDLSEGDGVEGADNDDADDGDDGDDMEEQMKKAKKLKKKFMREVACPVTAEQARANLGVVGKLGSKFLPSLFNVVLQTDANHRGNVITLISALCVVSSPKTVKKQFRKVLKMLLELQRSGQGFADEQKHSQFLALLDICLTMAPCADAEDAGFLHEAAKPCLVSAHGSEQKKGYRIFAMLCRTQPQWFANKWPELLDGLQESSLRLQGNAHRERVLYLKALVLRVPNLLQNKNALDKLPVILGEVMLATKETTKVKDSAFDLLRALGRRFVTLSEESGEDLMTQYIMMIMAGLGGSPNLQSAAVKALASLVFEFKQSITQNTLQQVLHTVAMLFHQRSKEVIKSVLGFVKVCVLSLEPENLQPHLREVVAGLMEWGEQSQNKFRSKIRTIFDILVRKYGAEVIRDLVPHSHVKLIDSIRKDIEKKKKEKAKARRNRKDGDDEEGAQQQEQAAMTVDQQVERVLYGNEGDDDDDEDAMRMKEQNSSRRKTDEEIAEEKRRARMEKKLRKQAMREEGNKKLWLKDETLDFMDTDVGQAIVTRNPSKQHDWSHITLGKGLEEDDQGRLIFTKKDRRRGGNNSDAMDVGREGDSSAVAGKRKRRGGGGNDEAGVLLGAGSSAAAAKRTKLGSKFRASSAGGDMTGKGKFQPHAYVPLDPKQLNKRERHKAGRRYAGVVQSAKSRQGGQQVMGNKMSKSKRKSLKVKHMREAAAGVQRGVRVAASEKKRTNKQKGGSRRGLGGR